MPPGRHCLGGQSPCLKCIRGALVIASVPGCGSAQSYGPRGRSVVVENTNEARLYANHWEPCRRITCIFRVRLERKPGTTHQHLLLPPIELRCCSFRHPLRSKNRTTLQEQYAFTGCKLYSLRWIFTFLILLITEKTRAQIFGRKLLGSAEYGASSPPLTCLLLLDRPTNFTQVG